MLSGRVAPVGHSTGVLLGLASWRAFSGVIAPRRHGIMGDEVHIERLRQAEELGADIADAERSERAANEPDAHVLAAAREAGRARTTPPAA
jgi:hypothetical protein